LPLGKKRKEIFLQISAVGEMSKDDEAMQAGRQAGRRLPKVVPIKSRNINKRALKLKHFP
jgi:hypothetical protein